jgi:hypothetical protein
MDHASKRGEREERERDAPIRGSQLLDQHDREEEVHRVRDEGERHELEPETRARQTEIGDPDDDGESRDPKFPPGAPQVGDMKEL